MKKSGTEHVGAQERARKRLLTLYRKSAKGHPSRSWRRVAVALGFNAGYLRNVVAGRRRASVRLLDALGVRPDSITISARPCRRCGGVHLARRCTRRPTFEENAMAYDAWLSNPRTQRALVERLMNQLADW